MKALRIMCLSVFMLLVTGVSFAGGFFFTCDVGGAQLKILEYDRPKREAKKAVRKSRRQIKKAEKAEAKRIRILDKATRRNARRIERGKDPLEIPAELATAAVMPEPFIDEDGFEAVGAFPRLLDRPRYSFVTVRVTAEGYEPFEADFENNKLGLNHFNISLIPESDVPDSLSLFGVGGTLVPRYREMQCEQYLVVIRNMTLWQQIPLEERELVGKDVEVRAISVAGGWFSAAFANKDTNITVRVGDTIAFIVRDIGNEAKLCGSRTMTVREEDMENGQLIIDEVRVR